MPRKPRVKIVVDTNVFVGNFLARNPRSANRRVVRSWFITRRFKLALSDEIKAEYLRIFREVLDFDSERIEGWCRRFETKRIVVSVNPGIKPTLSRDPNYDMFIAAALAAKAKFLLTNDRDLLEISENEKRKLKFQIVTPHQFPDIWEKSA